MYAQPLRATEVARLLCVSPNTLRAWDKRAHLEIPRTKGGHRRYEGPLVQAMVDAQKAGYQGPRILLQAKQVVDLGLYDEPPLLRVRMERVELRLGQLVKEERQVREALKELATTVRSLGERVRRAR